MTTEWKCIKCGQCCIGANVIVNLEAEAARFYSYFGIEISKVNDEYKGKFQTGTVCKFCRNKMCEIYENRPQICKDYPIVEKDGKKQCWGVNDGTYRK